MRHRRAMRPSQRRETSRSRNSRRDVSTVDQRDEARCARERAAVITTMAAVAVDRTTDCRCAQPADEQADRKSGHGEAQRPAALGRDQRQRQDRRIPQRSPRQNLRDAEHEHRAPGAGKMRISIRGSVQPKARNVRRRMQRTAQSPTARTYRISSTRSGGRHSRVPLSVMTTGRSISNGCSCMAAIRAESVSFGLSSPSSS